MRASISCVLLLGLPLWSAPTSPLPASSRVTVLVSFRQPHSTESFAAMHRQLQNLLVKAGISVDLRDRSEVSPRAEFSQLVLFEMKGRCEMGTWPVGALSDERGALAMAYSSDGKVLPFGEVECDRVRESLQRVLGRANPDAYQSAYGAALGIVMAHEIYHMLGDQVKHTHEGITKPSLSARELLEQNPSLTEIARAVIRDGLKPQH